MADLQTSTVGIRDETPEGAPPPVHPGIQSRDAVVSRIAAVKSPLQAEAQKPSDQLPPFAVSDQLTQKLTALPSMMFDEDEKPAEVYAKRYGTT